MRSYQTALVWLSQWNHCRPSRFIETAIGPDRRIGLMRLMVLGFLLLIGVVVAIALFLAARSPYSDVISSEMHEIGSTTQPLDISGPPQLGRRMNLSRTPELLIPRCPMSKA